ncbi:MAG: histidine phosphatase family protein [Deltaproteobacteria bacterium]|jgi:broad specificity phosphatase PhoE|nr:histidine phosphatase family protein [Deltaproteobacteria bacterium]
MATIYLVRHGVTPANRENRFAGRSGEALHPEGIEQIRFLGERLQQKNIAAIYCGPAKRTTQTAAILAAILSIPVTDLAGLDEISIPHWEGLTKDEIRQRHGSEYPTWLAAPQAFRLPGCETLQDVQDRAVRVVSGLLAGGREQHLLLVSHLVVLRCIVLYYRGVPLSDFRSVEIGNGAILELVPDGTDRGSVSFL